MKLSDFLDTEPDIENDADYDAWWVELENRSPFGYLFERVRDLEHQIELLRSHLRRHTHHKTGVAQVMENQI